MDQQAYPLTSASNSIAIKIRSPSVCRSDSASLLLDAGSIKSVTDSERTISTAESSPLSEYFSSRSTFFESSISVADSVKTVTNYTSTSTPSTPSEDTPMLLATDLVVVFMGPNGSGKSHLIDTLTGQLGQRTGSNLESCRTEVRAIRMFNHATYGDRLVLVDTPGFDDIYKTDLEILEIVSKWFQKVYEMDVKLAGIVYLHRITNSRMAGSPHRNLRMFGKICGDQAVKKVILVTTMWDKMRASGSEILAHNREKDLFERYWKVMIDQGASTARFNNSPGSAWKIIDTVTKQHEAEVLLLQEELVDLKRALNETQAGKAIYSDLQKLLAEQQDTMRLLSQQARDENNPMLAAQLEAERKRILQDLDKTFDEMKNLQISLGKRIMLPLSGKKARARALHF